MKRQHFVRFYSPGTFMPEETEKPIDSWDVALAMKMSNEITERYNATPFGFRFTTRSRGPQDLDSHESAHSQMYYLGGKVETLAEVEARATKADEILLMNMRGNGIKRILTNDNSWRFTTELNDDDIVLPYTPPAQKKKKKGAA